MKKDPAEDTTEDPNLFDRFFSRTKDKLAGPSNRAERWMLDYPLACGFILESLACLILASHSMLMRYGRNDLVEDIENHDKIFMVYQLPGGLSDMTEWFTVKGQESLVVPILFIVFGIGLFVVQNLLGFLKSPATKSVTLVAMLLVALIVFFVTS